MKNWALVAFLLGVLPGISAGSFLTKPSSPKKRCGRHEPSVLQVRALTAQSLFFKAREEEALKEERKSAQAKIPIQAMQELSHAKVQLPYQFNLSIKDAESSQAKQEVTIRLLAGEDLDTLVPMCVEEFGDPQTSLDDLIHKFPWQKPMKAQQFLKDWWDDFALQFIIYITFRSKLLLRDFQDYTLLVATLRDSEAGTNPTIVGLVELSQQPPDGHQTPAAFPTPLWYKKWYCSLNKLPEPNGWVTNLLVAPQFRGQGYSKLLMMAAEGLAREWACTAIHLHCDADPVSGKVAQKLYKSLGYDMVEDKNSPYGWMGSELKNKIFYIQGVALLYFRKILVER